MASATTKRTLSGRVKNIIEKSGYIQRCTECNRVVHNGHCVVHVDAGLEDDLRVKAKVDGHSNMFIINGEIAEKLLDISIDEAKETEDTEVEDRIEENVKEHEFSFEGKKLGDNFLVDNFERE
jgi:replication factor A1